MIEAHALPDTGSVSAGLIRRKHPPVLFAPPRPRAAPRPSPSRALVVFEEKPAEGWAADLRFFAICYLAGFVFFLIMLS